jgi:hypothetical protein
VDAEGDGEMMEKVEAKRCRPNRSIRKSTIARSTWNPSLMRMWKSLGSRETRKPGPPVRPVVVGDEGEAATNHKVLTDPLEPHPATQNRKKHASAMSVENL